jgi:3-oxoadipate CoA-transferase alpha subunit
MAMAAQTTVVETENLVEPHALDPDQVITPSVYVDRIVHVRNGRCN